MTDRQKALELLATEVAKVVAATFNDDWKKWARNAAPPDQAVALDLMSMRFQELSAGLGLLAERCSQLAGDLLDESS
jgi:hypothetical protein